MRQPPHNRNVPSHVWEDAERRYADYREQYEKLRRMGLDDAGADAYLDALGQLVNAVQVIDPSEVDFEHDDLAGYFVQAGAALAAMAALLKYRDRLLSTGPSTPV